MMNYNMTFGKYNGQTYEWLFFNDPAYVEWMYDKRIHRQNHHFDEEQGDYFAELFRRARHLQGTCPSCRERPLTRMSLSVGERFAGANHVSFYCDECEYTGDGAAIYSTPSFFADDHISADLQKQVIKAIKNRFIGCGRNLTQKRMEEFFHDDANFVRAVPGFFAHEHAGGVE